MDEIDGKKAALEHILKKFVPKAKKVRLMSKMKPDVDHSGIYDDEVEEEEKDAGDGDMLEKLLAKLSDKYPED